MRAYIAAVSGIICCLFSGAALTAELVLYNWEGYIADSVLEQFETETGHTIKQVFYGSDTERDDVMVNTKGKGFDLVVVESVSNQIMGDNGYFSPVAPTLLNSVAERWRDSCGKSGVPYLWGTVGILYRADLVNEVPDSWADLLRPSEENRGKISVLLDAVDTLIPPLKLLGQSMNDSSTENLKAAHELLQSQKQYVKNYEYVLSLEEVDSIQLALGYSGDQYLLMDEYEGAEWEYVIPSEGTGIWMDCIAIPTGSALQSEAQAFIQFINRPDIAAENAGEIWLATPNTGALELLDAELKEDPLVFPNDQVMARSELYQRHPNQAMSIRNRIIYSLER
ncbi:MAG: spermidine/putrescine ABC transporter substrate-binding protein [Candidatus Pelagadaptatus aseana]|uniref:ABC transporter substrate-binding protein n=1 Tax=Candidatus Pelagadaptatus aseana TaxID=3120508 RepID=UPI0039B26296